MNQLDITSFKMYTKNTLAAAIEEAVKIWQSNTIEIPLPDVLLMTDKQYQILRPDMKTGDTLDVDELKKANEQLYRTPYNIMEVRIKQFTLL